GPPKAGFICGPASAVQRGSTSVLNHKRFGRAALRAGASARSRYDIDGVAVSSQIPGGENYFRLDVVRAGEPALGLVVERRARNPSGMALASGAWKIRSLPGVHASMFRAAN